MNLSLNYTEKILQMFGETGQTWLNNIDNIIERNSKLYGLSDFKLIDNLTYNLVMTAKSKKYGEIIVKVGLPNKESISEIKTLDAYNGNFACKCYEHNFEDYFYILEKLKPGTNLLDIKD